MTSKILDIWDKCIRHCVTVFAIIFGALTHSHNQLDVVEAKVLSSGELVLTLWTFGCLGRSGGNKQSEVQGR